MKTANFLDTVVLEYEDSLFRLKEQIEPYLEFITDEGKPREDCDVPPKVLIYVSINRKETQYALIEAEASGVVMEPGAQPWQLNTRLRVIAEQVFREIAPDRVKDIIKRIEEGSFTLQELDYLSSELEGISTPTVRLIFQNTSPQEVAVSLLSSEKFDSKVQNKNALPEISELLRMEFGIKVSPEMDIPSFKRKLARLMLMGDLIAGLDREMLPDKIKAIPLPEEDKQLSEISHAVVLWRNRTDLRDSCVQWAEEVERELGLDKLNFSPEVLFNK